MFAPVLGENSWTQSNHPSTSKTQPRWFPPWEPKNRLATLTLGLYNPQWNMAGKPTATVHLNECFGKKCFVIGVYLVFFPGFALHDGSRHGDKPTKNRQSCRDEPWTPVCKYLYLIKSLTIKDNTVILSCTDVLYVQCNASFPWGFNGFTKKWPLKVLLENKFTL